MYVDIVVEDMVIMGNMNLSIKMFVLQKLVLLVGLSIYWGLYYG